MEGREELLIEDPIHLLMVEDNPLVHRQLRRCLERDARAQIAVSSAERVGRAVEMIAEGRFDIVLLDLNLPDSTGLSTLDAVLEADPELCVVIITGTADDTAGLEATRRGAQDWLSKGKDDKNGFVRRILFAYARHQRSKLATSQKMLDITPAWLAQAQKVIYSYSHATKQPLFTAKSALWMLQREVVPSMIGPAAFVARAAVGRLVNAVGRIRSVVRQGAQSYLDRDRVAGEIQQRDLWDEVRSVCMEAARLPDLVQADVNLCPDESSLRGLKASMDPALFGLAVTSALTNSAEAGARTVRLYGEEQGNENVLFIQDDGRGMPPAVLSKLTVGELPPSTKDPDRGGGVREMVGSLELMGGSVVWNSTSSGTTVQLRMLKGS